FERRGVYSRDASDVVEVVERRQVTILNSVFDAHVLMLMVVVLVRLGETHGGITTLQKWLMIAAASVAIASINHPDFHRRNVTFTGLFDEACKLARRRIVLTADTAACR